MRAVGEVRTVAVEGLSRVVLARRPGLTTVYHPPVVDEDQFLALRDMLAPWECAFLREREEAA